MEIQLLDLPQVCIEEIFRKLRFAEISRLGATCKYFREIAKTIFRLYFRNIEEVVETEMEKIETEANKPESLSIAEHLHLALLHSVLRILLSEAKMLKAHCWRYMREPSYDFCFPAGLILDEFERILKSVRSKTLKKDMEPEITTTLFHMGETFYDYFDFNIESHFKESSGLEVKIISETNRQTFLPNIYSFVSNLTRESLLRGIHRYMRKHRANEMQTTLTSHQPSCEVKNDEISKNENTCKHEKNFFQSIKNPADVLMDAIQAFTIALFYALSIHKISFVPNLTFTKWLECTLYEIQNSLNIFSFKCLVIAQGTNEKTLFGVKILDILNCCALSNFHTLLAHNCSNEGFKLKTHYELRDINVLEALPTIGLSIATSEKQLNKICRYIRNNVRWTNLFHPLQDLWMLEDAIEINRNVGTASALLRQWKLQRTSSKLNLNNTGNEVFQYDHRKIISRFKNRFGLLVSASLECPTLHNIPLKIDKCLESKYFIFDETFNMPECNLECGIPPEEFNNNTVQTDVDNSNCNITTYKFHLELKIQYPSFLSETVREAILKVDQVGEETLVSTDGDDMRKSATYRADEND